MNNNTSKGVGFFGLLSVILTAVFVILKLINYIAWSWLWVLAPIWIYISLCLLIIVIYVILLVMIHKELG